MVFHPEVNRIDEFYARVGEAVQAWLSADKLDALSPGQTWQEDLKGSVPEKGIGAAATIDELVNVVIPGGQRLTTPSAWGWITCGPTSVPSAVLAAQSLANPQRQTMTSFGHLEELSLDWLAQLCQLPEYMKGVYSSGGSTANLVALGGARQWALEQAGVDPAADGLDGRKLAIYTSTQAHHTVHRSVAVLGMGRRVVRAIPTDDRLRMDSRALRQALQQDQRDGVLPVAVVAAAGTTNTGAIDPLRECGELAKEFGTWFHVDGAYGLPGILDERVAHLYDGLDLADSAITDPHKWLGAPVGVAATFVRDRAILHRAFTQEPADYLEGSFAAEDVQVSVDSMGVPYFDFGVELSAPARGAMVWGILREIGVEGVRARVVADNDYARHIAQRAYEHPRLEVLAEPILSICGFRYLPPDNSAADRVNQQILRRLARETQIVVSSTVVNESFVLRPCFINARTEMEHVDEFVDYVIQFGDELSAIA